MTVIPDILHHKDLPPEGQAKYVRYNIDDHHIVVWFGQYPNGTLGEVQISIKRTKYFLLRNALADFSASVSHALKCGRLPEECARECRFEYSTELEHTEQLRLGRKICQRMFEDMLKLYGPSKEG